MSRGKLLLLIGVLLVCTIWIGYQFSGMFSGPRQVKPPDTPMHRKAGELNAKLFEDLRFRDVEFIINPQDSKRFKLYGGVHTAAELRELKARAAQLRPEGDYDLEVEIMNRSP